MPLAFAEDLKNYNVESDGARVTRPALAEVEAGWEPTSAVHLEGEAAERAESQEMDDYYRVQAYRWRQEYLWD